VSRIQTISAYVGLGSNQGRPEENLAHAGVKIRSMTGVFSALGSQVYYTEPQGVKDQPWFANQVLRIVCHPAWSPQLFMRHLLNIECMLGRKREIPWGPRRIDCDLLLFGGHSICQPDLTLPHPRMVHRAFVLVPLLELDPDLCLPDGSRLSDCLDHIAYRRHGRRIWQEDQGLPAPDPMQFSPVGQDKENIEASGSYAEN